MRISETGGENLNETKYPQLKGVERQGQLFFDRTNGMDFNDLEQIVRLIEKGLELDEDTMEKWPVNYHTEKPEEWESAFEHLQSLATKLMTLDERLSREKLIDSGVINQDSNRVIIDLLDALGAIQIPTDNKKIDFNFLNGVRAKYQQALAGWRRWLVYQMEQKAGRRLRPEDDHEML